MADIARECGVTKMTVSRVLAGRDGVKKSTREKVMAAASRLNYEVNSLAQSFSSNRSGVIGIATPFDGLLGSSYFKDAVNGFRRVLDDTVISFSLFDTNSESFNDGEKLEKLYRQRRVDGLLLLAVHTTDQFLKTLEQLRIPMVVVGERVDYPNVCSVSCRDRDGMRQVCEHLFQLGHLQIGFVEGPGDFSTAARRKEGFIESCQKNQVKIPIGCFQQGHYNTRGGREAGRILLRQNPRPTAIICANDAMAYGVVESVRELGLRIPQDISIVGFDNETAAADMFPPLTTVHQPVSEMGEHAAQILLDAITDNKLPVGQKALDVSLIVRESTAPPAE
ncbi:MAG: LacI family DNA-binding transcriptional regulator [Gloeobacteraceae cyanobacterium ES-bin-144]|nr:LacI family DNA-binding transcriptional regulator [Verrucomicrobiales bacterium]